MSSCNDPCADNISIIVDTGSQGPIGPPGPAAKVVEWTYYLNPGDTIISGEDASTKPLAYTPDSVQVYLNGVQLSKRDDYTTDEDGLSIVLNEAIVNANDIMVIVSQVPPENYDPTNEHNRLQGQIDDNKEAIDGLDVRITANETAIENLEGLAGGFTTRDVKVSGVSPQRGRGEELQTQQDINYLFDGEILENTARIEAIEGGQPDQTQDIKDLRTDVDENTQGISDNATALNDLVDVVESNSTEIDGLQTQIDQLPPPTDISDLEQDFDGLAKSVGSNTIAIAKNTADIAALPEMTIDLEPLNDAIADNAAGVNQNAKDIVSLKATDATLTGKVNDLESAVGDLEAIDIPEDIAFTNIDNAFDTAQTIKDGLNITGKNAFIEMDRGTALTVSNNNAYNSVIEIERSSGDVSLQLQADGQIRGVKTDGTDDTSAVSVGWFQDNVGAGGGDVDLSKYATLIDLKTEEVARIQGDDKLAADLAEAILTEKYNDTALTNRIAAEEKARAAADSTLSGKISNETQYRKEEDAKLQAAIDAIEIPDVNLEGYATEAFVIAATADFATENFVEEAIGAIEFPGLPEGLATETYVNDAIDAIEFPAGTVISDTAPVDPEEGATWYDTVRLELFVFASGSWLPASPLGARVEQGEVLQAEILSRVSAGEKEQNQLKDKVEAIDSKKLDRSGGTANKMTGNLYMGGFFIAGIGEPTAGNHAATMQYVDNKVASIVQSGTLDPYASNFIMPGYGLTGAGDSVGGEGVFKFVRMDGEGFTANPKDSRGICFDIRKYPSFFGDLRTKLDSGTCYGTGIIYIWDETVSNETGLIAKYRVTNKGDYDTQGGGSFLIYGDQLMARIAASTTHTYRIELVGF